MGHIDLKLVLMVLDGQLPPSVVLRAAYEHLKEVCPECGETLKHLRHVEPQLTGGRDSKEGGGPPSEDFDPRLVAVFDAEGERARERSRLVEVERRRALSDLRHLLALPAEERESRIENARSRFRSRALAELLLAECRRVTRQDPTEAANLAALAYTVVLWTPGALKHRWAEIIQARSAALRANAARVSGDLREADRLFVQVQRAIATLVPSDCELHAEICSLKASLRMDQRRFDEAESLLERSILIYRQEATSDGLAKTLVKMGALRLKAGRYLESIDSSREAIAFLDPDSDRFLYLCAVSNLALGFCELEEFSKASEVVQASQPHYTAYDDEWTRVHHLWLEGRIALGLEEWEQAEAALKAARDGIIGIGNGLSAALVSLDLAMLYLQCGRTAELKGVARLMAPLFEAQDVHREAVAALLLFQKAVATEQVTAETINGLRSYLDRARSNPKLKYESPL